MSDEKITIIYDTYCGWCHGASEVFDEIEASGAEVEVLHRHLFAGDNELRMGDGKGAQILGVIPTVEKLTGAKFTDAYKEKIAGTPDEVLTSHFSAQAAALVHDQGTKKEFEVRRKLEALHFDQGVSTNDRAAIVATLIEMGIPAGDAEKLGTPDLAAKAKELSDRAKSLMQDVGSRGVPTVIKGSNGDMRAVDHQSFYGRAKDIRSVIS